MVEIYCALKIDAISGESPVWSVKEQILYWVDIPSCLIHRFDPRSNVNSSIKLPQPVAALGLRKKGGLILALAKGIALFDLKTHAIELIGAPEKNLPDNRFNDGKCDKQGRFWCGTMNETHLDSPSGNLYRVDRNHQISCMQTKVALANGIGWSPDQSTMYFTETMLFTIFAYDFSAQTGSISNKRVFAKIDPYPRGGPDGLTVDREGCVWSALYGKGQIIRYTPDGKIERIIKLPVPCPTSCTFGGANLDTMYITSAKGGLSPAELAQFPLSGSILAFKPGVQGIAEGYYEG